MLIAKKKTIMQMERIVLNLSELTPAKDITETMRIFVELNRLYLMKGFQKR